MSDRDSDDRAMGSGGDPDWPNESGGICFNCGIDRRDIDSMHAKCAALDKENKNLTQLHKDYRSKLVQLRADVYDAVDTLEQLIEWDVYMGEFENPVWDRARGVVARINGQRFP